MNRISFFFVTFCVVLGFAFAYGYNYVQIQRELTREARLEAEAAVRALAFREEIVSRIKGTQNLTEENIRRGFWYEYTDNNGNTAVAYFDLAQLSRAGMSSDEIEKMRLALKNSRLIDAGLVQKVPENELPSLAQFHNSILAPREDDYYVSEKATLTQKNSSGKATIDDLKKLEYLYSLEGNYSERDNIRAKNCKLFKSQCARKNNIKIFGVVRDIKKNKIQGATITVVGRETKPVFTDSFGKYAISIASDDLEKLRIRAVKRNYSDGLSTIVTLSSRNSYEVPDIILSAPLEIFTIDNQQNTITGDKNKYENENFIVKTDLSIYEIPQNSFVRSDGSLYKGIIDVYVYEFTQDTIPESLMRIDTFDQVRGYAGDLMKTFGMPYIQFFAPNGEELHILSANPMKLTYKIKHMKELRENNAKIYSALTKKDMEFLVKESLAPGYNIDRAFLIQNGMLRFPAFWVYDRARGVWEDIAIDVKDADGTIESEFYTIKSLPNFPK